LSRQATHERNTDAVEQILMSTSVSAGMESVTGLPRVSLENEAGTANCASYISGIALSVPANTNLDDREVTACVAAIFRIKADHE
jgi:hypothetical protein